MHLIKNLVQLTVPTEYAVATWCGLGLVPRTLPCLHVEDVKTFDVFFTSTVGAYCARWLGLLVLRRVSTVLGGLDMVFAFDETELKQS
jgi:hypothetical protein